MTHQPVSVVSQCSLIAWLNGLASGDQRRFTGSGSTLEACLRRCDIQMAAFALLMFCYASIALISCEIVYLFGIGHCLLN